MTSSRPVCDKHPNLQMLTCSLNRTTSSSQGHVCPVPCCGRHHDDEGYFDVVETAALIEENSPKGQHDVARAAIMKVLRQPRSWPKFPG